MDATQSYAGWTPGPALKNPERAFLYEARHAGSGRKGILRLLPLTDVLAEATLEAARGLSGIREDGLLCVLECGRQDGMVYVVYDAFDGLPLPRWLAARGGGVAPDVAARIVAEAARGLGAAHRRPEPMAYGSLRPDVLLVGTDPSGRARTRVSGLDLALASRAKGTFQALHGMEYRAPEQIKGLEGPSPRADVYALGLILKGLLDKSVPAALAPVLERCLEADPARRFSDGTTLAEALEAALGRPVEVVLAEGAPGRLTCEDPHVRARVGAPVRLNVTVHNTGVHAEHFGLRVEGVPAEWFEWRESDLFQNPGDRRAIGITVKIPDRLDALAGTHTFRLHLTSRRLGRDLPEPITVTLEIEPNHRWTVEVDRRTRRHHRKATYQMTARNSGNIEEVLTFHATGEELSKTFNISPTILRVPPGQAAEIRLTVEAPHTNWISAREQHRVQVDVNAQEPGRSAGERYPEAERHKALHLEFVHQRRVPYWTVLVTLLALLGVLGLSAWWVKTRILDVDDDGFWVALSEPRDQCPDQEAAAPDDALSPKNGCPRLPDADNDGVADANPWAPILPLKVDACPTLAETQHECDPTPRDGCPIEDADKDGIPDLASGTCQADLCLGLVEDFMQGAPRDGCPGLSGNRDGDELPDERDMCPDAKGETCAKGCVDTDGDCVGDSSDNCSSTPKGEKVDEQGCSEEQIVSAAQVHADSCVFGKGLPGGLDEDKDCFLDVAAEKGARPPDLCLKHAGRFEGCEDIDGDGKHNKIDPCPRDPKNDCFKYGGFMLPETGLAALPVAGLQGTLEIRTIPEDLSGELFAVKEYFFTDYTHWIASRGLALDIPLTVPSERDGNLKIELLCLPGQTGSTFRLAVGSANDTIRCREPGPVWAFLPGAVGELKLPKSQSMLRISAVDGSHGELELGIVLVTFNIKVQGLLLKQIRGFLPR